MNDPGVDLGDFRQGALENPNCRFRITQPMHLDSSFAQVMDLGPHLFTVVGQLRAVFRTPELVARTYREAKARETEEIERLRAEMGKLESLRAVGEMTDPDLAHRLVAIARELQVLETHGLSEKDVIDALERLDPVWDELFPNEKARIVQLLVERVDVHEDGIQLRLRTDGLRSLVAELTAPKGAAG